MFPKEPKLLTLCGVVCAWRLTLPRAAVFYDVICCEKLSLIELAVCVNGALKMAVHLYGEAVLGVFRGGFAGGEALFLDLNDLTRYHYRKRNPVGESTWVCDMGSKDSARQNLKRVSQQWEGKR